jgi:hypothetical protein
MNSIIEELLGYNVQVRSQWGQSEGRDEGVLEACDGRWIRLRKDNGETLYFPIANVRLVKPISS